MGSLRTHRQGFGLATTRVDGRRLRRPESFEPRELLAVDCTLGFAAQAAAVGSWAPSAPSVGSYDSMAAASNLGNLTTFSTTASVSSSDPQDYYVFRLASKSNFSLKLTGLKADADVELIKDSNGDQVRQSSEVLAASINAGAHDEAINKTLDPGTYYVRVFQYSGNTPYTLSLSATVVAPNLAPTVAQAARAISSVVAGTSVNLSVLGADDGGEPNLTYTWTVAAPTGAVAPTFSANGSNAAKNTTATFRTAGDYTFTATIKDGSGLSVTSTVKVTVSQTLTAIAVTPGSASVALGGSQQFSARATDQFGNALSTQPAITWSTSLGKISATGLLTAPTVAGSGAVTAKAGTVAGSASLTVGTVVPNFLNLKDKALADLTWSLDADGSISRADMIKILQATGSDDQVVDTNEFADLKTILSNYTTLNMASYVQVLAGDVINGNPANALYQGQALGNLAAGSSATQLNELVGKWFLGADHPVASGYTYRAASGVLFVNGPGYTDMHQGYLGDCYLISSLGAIAKSVPTAIQNMFIDNGDGTWTVRLYANGTADYVTVDRMLPTDSSGRLVFSNAGVLASAASNELWMALAEKAYAQWNETRKEGRDGKNNYASIEGGWMATVDAQVLGRAAASYALSSSNDNQALIQAVTANKAVTIGTNGSPGNGLYGSHAYAVIGYDAATGKFTLYNPWGSNQPGPLTWAQLQQSCSSYVVADASGTTPIAMTLRATVTVTIGVPAASPSTADGGLAAVQSATSDTAPRAHSRTDTAAQIGDPLAQMRLQPAGEERQAMAAAFNALGADALETSLVHRRLGGRFSAIGWSLANGESLWDDVCIAESVMAACK